MLGGWLLSAYVNSNRVAFTENRSKASIKIYIEIKNVSTQWGEDTS